MVFPAAMTLVAATNPCPYGWHGDHELGCRCTCSQRQRYWQWLSGPLFDRIDLQLRLDRRSSRQIQICLDATQRPKTHSPWLEPLRVNTARQRMQAEIPVFATIARSRQQIYTATANSRLMGSRCGSGLSNSAGSPPGAACNYSGWPAPLPT